MFVALTERALVGAAVFLIAGVLEALRRLRVRAVATKWKRERDVASMSSPVWYGQISSLEGKIDEMIALQKRGGGFWRDVLMGVVGYLVTKLADWFIAGLFYY